MEVNEQPLSSQCDRHGFLRDWSAWTPNIAEAFAQDEDIVLTEAHWEVLHLLRTYYKAFDSSPANRALVNWVKRHAGPDKGNSIYLMGLFPGSPARVGSRIAGLPKPKNCL